MLLTAQLSAAKEIELKPHNLIAIPYQQINELKASGITFDDPKKIIADFAHVQALIECRAHFCGISPCTNVINETHSLRSAADGHFRKVKFHEMPGGFPGSVEHIKMESEELSLRPHPGPGHDEYYFDTIECSDEVIPSPKDAILSVTAINKLLKDLQYKTCRDEERDRNLKRLMNSPIIPTACLLAGAGLKGALDFATTAQMNDTAEVQFCKFVIKASGISGVLANKVEEINQANLNRATPIELFAEKDKKYLANENNLKKLKIKFAELKEKGQLFQENEPVLKSLMATAHKKIEKQKEYMRTMPYAVDNFKPDDDIKTVHEIINLPTQVQRVNPTEVTPKLQHLLSTYSPDNQKALSDFIDKIDDAADAPIQDRYIRKNMAYFYGPPGTGKTKAARDIAAALGVPFFEILVKDKTPEQVFAEIDGFLKTCPVKNPIIFIDEAGDALNPPSSPSAHSPRGSQYSGSHQNRTHSSMAEAFLPFTNPNDGKYLSPSIKLPHPGGMGSSSRSEVEEFEKLSAQGIHHDISRLTMIFAGNVPLKDEALAQRVSTITFGKVDIGIRGLIARNMLTEKFKKQFIDPETISKSDLETLNHIVKRDHELYEGVRVIEDVINDYAIYQKTLRKTPRLDLLGHKAKNKTTNPPFDFEASFSSHAVLEKQPLQLKAHPGGSELHIDTNKISDPDQAAPQHPSPITPGSAVPHSSSGDSGFVGSPTTPAPQGSTERGKTKKTQKSFIGVRGF